MAGAQTLEAKKVPEIETDEASAAGGGGNRGIRMPSGRAEEGGYSTSNPGRPRFVYPALVPRSAPGSTCRNRGAVARRLCSRWPMPQRAALCPADSLTPAHPPDRPRKGSGRCPNSLYAHFSRLSPPPSPPPRALHGIFRCDPLVTETAQGVLLAKAKRAADREWLDNREVNSFLKRAQKTPRFKELAVERICQARTPRGEG